MSHNTNKNMPGGRMRNGALGGLHQGGFSKLQKSTQTESDKRAFEKRVEKRRAKKKRK